MPNVSFVPHAADRVTAVLAQLKTYLGEKVSTNHAVCEAHSHGEALDLARMLAAVISAKTTEDGSPALAICRVADATVVAFGAVMSCEGPV